MSKAIGLPFGALPMGLSRSAAAEYIGVGVCTFDSMVADGRMPPPRLPQGKRKVWLRTEIDTAMLALPTADGAPDDRLQGWEGAT